MKSYEVVILGAGSAGLAARKEVSKLTEDYLVIDPGPLGTTCARVGCMPSKALIEAANHFHDRGKYATFGVEGANALKLNGAAFMQHVRLLRDRYVGGVLKGMEPWMDKRLVKGSAKFLDPDTIEVTGVNLSEKIQAKRFIVATGSSPDMPLAWRSMIGLLTTDSIFEMIDLPQRLAVVGLGAVGLELSQAFARTGVEVTAYAKGLSVGGLTNPELIGYAKAQLRKEITLVEEEIQSITALDGHFDIKTASGTKEYERVLIATGRKPNLEELDLKAAGAKFKDGHLQYSRETFRIEGTALFIAGDVDGERPILHEAVDQGRIAGYNAVHEKDLPCQQKSALKIAFSSPQIAVIGKSHRELTEAKTKFLTGKSSYENQGRAVLKMVNIGKMEIYACEKGKILGAELFVPDGEHLAHLLAWAMQCKLDVFTVLANPFYHPTLEEGMRQALQEIAKLVKEKPNAADAFRCESPSAGTSIY